MIALERDPRDLVHRLNAAEQDGFVNDPRGGNYVCEECNKPYHIPTDARISFN